MNNKDIVIIDQIPLSSLFNIRHGNDDILKRNFLLDEQISEEMPPTYDELQPPPPPGGGGNQQSELVYDPYDEPYEISREGGCECTCENGRTCTGRIVHGGCECFHCCNFSKGHTIMGETKYDDPKIRQLIRTPKKQPDDGSNYGHSLKGFKDGVKKGIGKRIKGKQKKQRYEEEERTIERVKTKKPIKTKKPKRPIRQSYPPDFPDDPGNTKKMMR